ncbi:MAG: DUF2911 domain-containing protein [Pyrinomonadaceae bacterium]
MGLAIFVGTLIGLGQDVTTPRPVSPAAEVKQTIGLSDVTVNYSRPRLTLNGVDRSGKIWGQQVPYGLSNPGGGTATQAPWRAGANENTVITFSDDVKIDGKPLQAGKYGFHIIVNDGDKATLIFSKTHTSWGNFFYDAKDDALRVDITTKVIPNTEVLTYAFEDMGNDFAVLALSWEKKKFPFKIEFDVHKIVLARFRDELRGLPGFGWQGFQTAATYCLNNNINLEEALGWADIAATRNKTFPTLSTKAAVLYQMGRQAESEKILDDAIASATMPQINAVGYQLLAAKRYAKAIEVLQINVKNNPTDANSFDSLGEAYKMSGDKDNAVKNLKKSLSLNPPAPVKANSEKLLRELGEI